MASFALEHLTFSYPGQTRPALDDLTLTIPEGAVTVLCGESGSGKSTIIKLLTGEIVPTSGQIAVNGFSLTNIAERQIPLLRRSVGVIFQDFRLIEKKTVYENLGFAMRAVGSSPREIKKRIPYVLELVGLEEKTDRYPNELSGGEQQMLAMGRALMSNASMLMLDEPSMGLSPLLVQEIFDIIRDIHKEGMTILLVEQNAQMALSVADRAYVLETGRVVMDGTGAELLTNERVRNAYLGG